MTRWITGLVLALAVLAVAASGAWAGAPCSGTSTVWADSATAQYEDTIDIYVIVRDCYGQPLNNRVGNFFTDRTGDIIIGNPVVTDVTGFAQAKLTGRCMPPDDVSTIFCNCEGILLGGDWHVTWWCMAGIGDQLPETAAGFTLAGSAPNPFRGATTIRYSVAGPTAVRLEIYDVFGRSVKTLEDAAVGAGWHSATWDGTDRLGHKVAPGIYHACLSTNRQNATAKLMLLQ